MPVVGRFVLTGAGHVEPHPLTVLVVEGRFVSCMVMAPVGGRQHALGGGGGVCHPLLCVFFVVGALTASEKVQLLTFSTSSWAVCKGYLLSGVVIPLLVSGFRHLGARGVSLLPDAPNICAGRGGAGVPGGEVTVVGDALPAC